MSNPPQQRSFSRYGSIFRQSQSRPTAPQPQPRPPAPAPQVRPPAQQEPTPPPPSQPAPRAPPSPPPPPAARPPPPPSPKPIAPREDSTVLTSGQRSPAAPSSPSASLPQRQPAVPLSPVPSRPAADPTAATGSPLLTSGQRSPVASPPVAPSPPSMPPAQQKPVVPLAPSPPRPTDLATTNTTNSPVLTSGQRSPVPGTPTKSPVAAPPRAPSSLPSPNRSPAEPHSPVLNSGHRSPVSVHPTASQVPSSPDSFHEPPYSPLLEFHSPLGEANHHHRMKPVSPLKLPKQAHPEMSDLEQEDHKKVVLLEGQTTGRNGSLHGAAAKNKEVKKEKGASFVTLAGENRGAVMELITSPAGKKQGMVMGNKCRARKLVEDEGEEEEEEEEEDGGNLNGVPRMMRAVVNSNVQGVNNSILHNTTYSHHDPGIHLVYPGRSRRSILNKISPDSR